jgi:post-segregation antitoxin (ccd killing protein)
MIAKAKVTITVNRALVEKARKRAVIESSTLSRLVEQALQQRVEESAPTFSETWRGTLKPSRRHDARTAYLAKRHA